MAGEESLHNTKTSQANTSLAHAFQITSGKPYGFSTYIFDLDGTLLDTLADLVALTNAVLEQNGYPQRTKDQIRSYIGNGVRGLITQAVPESASKGDIEKAIETWIKLYPQFGYKLTTPYPYLTDVLRELRQRNVKLGVLSNKFDEATRELVATYYPYLFDVVHGQREGIPRKPDPAGLNDVVQQLDANPQKTAYIGDSGGDMQAARNANLFGIGVTWGYQSVQRLQECGACAIVDDPRTLLQWVSMDS